MTIWTANQSISGNVTRKVTSHQPASFSSTITTSSSCLSIPRKHPILSYSCLPCQLTFQIIFCPSQCLERTINVPDSVCLPFVLLFILALVGGLPDSAGLLRYTSYPFSPTTVTQMYELDCASARTLTT